ncbi:MAG: glycosyltransferase [Candidatus Poribacteria bacterium]
MNLILIYILIPLTFVYFAISLTLLIGTIIAKKIEKINNSYPYVSIIVPAKNEEEMIGKCLDSLINQDYPKNKYEVVVINDRSTDKTQDIINLYQKNSIIKSIEIKENLSGLTGKQNAVNEGLKLCKGEIIMNIDADCIAKPKWIKNTVSRFMSKTGLVMGFNITYNDRNSSSVFAELQALDMLFLLDSATGSIGVGVYAGCAGSNIAYRKAVLKDENFQKLGFTITEDTAVIQAVSKNPNWDVKVVYDKDAMVMTPAETSWRRFFAQRIRWTLGGLVTKSWILLPLYLAFLYHVMLITLIPIAFFVNSLQLAVLLSFVIKSSIDFIRCCQVCKSFDRTDLLKFFMLYEFFMMFYSVFIGFVSLFVKKIEWKGDVYNISKKG